MFQSIRLAVIVLATARRMRHLEDMVPHASGATRCANYIPSLPTLYHMICGTISRRDLHRSSAWKTLEGSAHEHVIRYS